MGKRGPKPQGEAALTPAEWQPQYRAPRQAGTSDRAIRSIVSDTSTPKALGSGSIRGRLASGVLIPTRPATF